MTTNLGIRWSEAMLDIVESKYSASGGWSAVGILDKQMGQVHVDEEWTGDEEEEVKGEVDVLVLEQNANTGEYRTNVLTIEAGKMPDA